MASLGEPHEGIVSSCLVYRALISDPSKIGPIGLLLRKAWEMPPSIPWPTSVVAPRSWCATELDLLVSALCDRRWMNSPICMTIISRKQSAEIRRKGIYGA